MLSLKTITVALTASALAAPALAQAPIDTVVVLPFAVAAHGDPSPACLPIQEPAALDAVAASALPAQLSRAVAGQLAARPGLRVYGRGQDSPAGALIVAGCIQRAEAGDAVKRLVGLGMGASTLSAHIQLYRDDHLLREFDVAVTGTNKLPPIGPVGLAVHGVRDLHESLGADATKLSRRIADQIDDR
jgi:hypothetical protein